MTVINKVPAKPTKEAVLRLATSEVIYYAFQQTLLESRDLSSCTKERSLFADALETNRKLMSCSFLLERKNNGEAL